jgi:membrane protease YdiL (CAAX protease family)
MESRQQASALWRTVFDGVQWRPNRDTIVALGSYVLVVATMWVAFQVFTTAMVAANFLTFTLAIAGFGVIVPVVYTVMVRRRGLADIGITTRALVPSLVLGALLGLDTFRNTIAGLPDGWLTASLVPLVLMTQAVGLFEAIFFRGFLQLRFEEAFGIVPGLILGALAYALYHVGYGMTSGEVIFLFGYGMVFGAIFRLTRNIFVLWPFYTPVGGLYSNLRNGLNLPFEATYGFVLVIALMLAVAYLGWRWTQRHAVGADSPTSAVAQAG